MTSRTDDCVVYLPTGNRTGSVKMLSLATGRIVTRDTFKVLPMRQSVVALLNEMAKLDSRTIARAPYSFNDLQYNQSVNNANMPHFAPVLPPNRDAVEIQGPVIINPIVIPAVPILADTPPDIVVNRGEAGGGTRTSYP